MKNLSFIKVSVLETVLITPPTQSPRQSDENFAERIADYQKNKDKGFTHRCLCRKKQNITFEGKQHTFEIIVNAKSKIDLKKSAYLVEYQDGFTKNGPWMNILSVDKD